MKIMIALIILLFVNLIDTGTTYYAFNLSNNPTFEEIGLLRTPEGKCTNTAIYFHLGFTLLLLGLCFYILKYKTSEARPNFIKGLKLFIWLWLVFDSLGAINNLYWIVMSLKA